MLLDILTEWFECYEGEGAVKDFYAEKLSTAARLMLCGESCPNQLRDALARQPDRRTRFFYDSDEWESLEKRDT